MSQSGKINIEFVINQRERGRSVMCWGKWRLCGKRGLSSMYVHLAIFDDVVKESWRHDHRSHNIMWVTNSHEVSAAERDIFLILLLVIYQLLNGTNSLDVEKPSGKNA
jgi:hypothetical protein